MNTVVATLPPTSGGGVIALTAKEMRAHVQVIQQVMRGVMKEGVHYGTIPGTPKPSLWKPGAEVLCVMFRIAPTYRVDDLSDSDRIRYRVVCVGTHQTSAVILGEGMGEASSNEKKYKWQKANPKEWDNTDVDRRRIQYGWDREKGQDYEILQVRTEPADLANTILKMACKRAQVAMTLNVTGASDIFSQDLEDLPDGVSGDEGRGNAPQARGKPQTQAPRSSGGNGKATPKQVNLVKSRIDAAGIAHTDFLEQFGLQTFEDIPFAKVNEALGWIQQNAGGSGNGGQ